VSIQQFQLAKYFKALILYLKHRPQESLADAKVHVSAPQQCTYDWILLARKSTANQRYSISC